MSNHLFAITLLSTSLVLTACGGGGGGGNGSTTTGGGNTTNASSHNAGQNCLDSSCHGSGGNGPTFSSAGTIYSSSNAAQTNATVRFYVAGTNTLITEVTTDGSGNFYTDVDLSTHFSGAGVSPEVEGPSGGISSMVTAVSGACNASGCHASNNRIRAN